MPDRDHEHEQDGDLSRILQQWQVPAPGAALDRRVLRAYRHHLHLRPLTLRLLAGYRYDLRVGASVLLAASVAVVIAVIFLSSHRWRSTSETQPAITPLADTTTELQRRAHDPRLELDTLLLELDARPSVLTSLNTSGFEPLPEGALRVILNEDKR